MAFTRSGVRSSLAPPFFSFDESRALGACRAHPFMALTIFERISHFPLFELRAYRGKQGCPMAFFAFDKLFCPRVAA